MLDWRLLTESQEGDVDDSEIGHVLGDMLAFGLSRELRRPVLGSFT
jgi:hypothetical protein